MWILPQCQTTVKNITKPQCDLRYTLFSNETIKALMPPRAETPRA